MNSIYMVVIRELKFNICHFRHTFLVYVFMGINYGQRLENNHKSTDDRGWEGPEVRKSKEAKNLLIKPEDRTDY